MAKEKLQFKIKFKNTSQKGQYKTKRNKTSNLAEI